MMNSTLKIDFVSDVSCPWCVIGLKALEQAIATLGDEVSTEIHFQPFELNPQMASDGQELYEHMAQKYGASKTQSDSTREMIRARGEELGFEFRMDRLERIYNTFDTHRILHWAGIEGVQRELKMALFDAYFTDGKNPGSPDVLVETANTVGLDGERARQILMSDEFSEEVRRAQSFYHQQGIHAVPAIIINDRHLLQGGQPVEVFEQALRQILSTTESND